MKMFLETITHKNQDSDYKNKVVWDLQMDQYTQQ
jgi:hypothetical protein